jgi:uncharacterized protein (TIGR02391 family)
MSNVHRFFYKYCGSGHMLYSVDGPPARARCERCGDAYIEACPACGHVLENAFTSRVYFTNGTPISLPKRPDYCRSCGKPLPWMNKEVRRVEASGLWALLHPRVVEIAQPRFEAGHYADAVEAVFKQLNAVVKAHFREATGEELDGVPLMRRAFALSKPVLVLDDLTTESGRNIQQGYLDIFAGSMAGIRNPKAHENVVISADRAAHYLTLASLLFSKLDERR